MKRTVRTSSLPILIALTALLASLAAAPGCTGEPGGALDEGCQTHADCPNPARQRCVPEWGVCVGQTNELGELGELKNELGDLQDPDAGT